MSKQAASFPSQLSGEIFSELVAVHSPEDAALMKEAARIMTGCEVGIVVAQNDSPDRVQAGLELYAKQVAAGDRDYLPKSLVENILRDGGVLVTLAMQGRRTTEYHRILNGLREEALRHP